MILKKLRLNFNYHGWRLWHRNYERSLATDTFDGGARGDIKQKQIFVNMPG